MVRPARQEARGVVPAAHPSSGSSPPRVGPCARIEPSFSAAARRVGDPRLGWAGTRPSRSRSSSRRMRSCTPPSAAAPSAPGRSCSRRTTTAPATHVQLRLRLSPVKRKRLAGDRRRAARRLHDRRPRRRAARAADRGLTGRVTLVTGSHVPGEPAMCRLNGSPPSRLNAAASSEPREHAPQHDRGRHRRRTRRPGCGRGRAARRPAARTPRSARPARRAEVSSSDGASETPSDRGRGGRLARETLVRTSTDSLLVRRLAGPAGHHPAGSRPPPRRRPRAGSTSGRGRP